MVHGRNTIEAQKQVSRGRARLVAAVMSELEAKAFPHMPGELAKQVEKLVKDEINLYSDGIVALLREVVDETAEMSPAAMELLMAIADRVGVEAAVRDGSR